MAVRSVVEFPWPSQWGRPDADLRQEVVRATHRPLLSWMASFLAEGRPLAPEGPPDVQALGQQGQLVNPEMAFGC